MAPKEVVADYFQGLDWRKGKRLNYVAWAGVAKSGAQKSCCYSFLLSYVLCLMKDSCGKLDSLKLILLYLSISPCKRKTPSCCCRQHCVCLASGRAGVCRKAVIFSWQKVSEPLCAGVEMTAALFSQTCESFGEIQSPTETRWTNKSVTGVSVIWSCLILCPILSHIVEASALENWTFLLIALSPTQLLVTHFN